MFCTNGVLLRMLTSGDGLEGVTHIVVDEIHERDKFADFLLIMLRDLLPSKPHLHLLLMSATLNVQLFTDYFSGCPLLQVPGYTYPVQVLQYQVTLLQPWKQLWEMEPLAGSLACMVPVQGICACDRQPCLHRF